MFRLGDVNFDSKFLSIDLIRRGRERENTHEILFVAFS